MTYRSLNILSEPFDPEDAHKSFRNAVSGAGAIVAFTGLVRGVGGGKDLSLTLSHYPDFTEAEIERIAQTAEQRWRLSGWQIIHRVGRMKADEPIVFVATASQHRRAAFEAADFLMDYLKSEVPLWKRETVDGQESWIEPRAGDIDDKKRWSS